MKTARDSSSKSISWINNIKAICIISVFFVHCQLYYGYMFDGINRFVYPWYVNAFFFVSGYLLFWKQLSEPRINEDAGQFVIGGGKSVLSNVFYRIVIPSILFSVIEFVPSSIIQGRRIDKGIALYKTIGGGTYWFTSALVVAEFVLLLLFCTRRRNIWFYAAACLALGILGVVIVHMGILNSGIWAWRQGLIALIFLAFGGLYWRYEKQVDKLMKWWFVLPMTVVYVAIVLFCESANPLISTLTIEPLGFLVSVIACQLLVGLCKKLPEIKPLTFIGQNSIGFYFMSGALPISLGILAHKAVAGNHLLLLLTVWVACLVAAYCIVLAINRWLPWLWDLRKKRN